MSGSVDRGAWVLRELDEWLMPTLGAYDSAVFRFIVRRTLMLGRIRWGISVKEMERGVTIDGKVVCLGTGFSRSTIKRSLDKLESMHLIVRGKKKISKILAINVIEVDEDEFDNLVERYKKMARRKGTDSPGFSQNLTGVLTEPSQGSQRTTTRVRSNTEGKTTEGTAKTPDTIAEAVIRAKEKNREGNIRRSKKVKEGAPTMGAVNAYAAQLVAQYELQSIAPLTGKDYGVFRKHYLVSPEPWQTVMEWLVPHWGSVAQNHFEYDTKFPLIPSLRFMAYNWRRLLEAYRQDARRAGDYRKADERKAAKVQRHADAERQKRLEAEALTKRLEQEAVDKDQQIRDLRTRTGDDKPYQETDFFRKMYHDDR